MPDIPICGYQTIAGPCRTARETLGGKPQLRCGAHRLRNCTGCGGTAVGDCTVPSTRFGSMCADPICHACRHDPVDDTHTSGPSGEFVAQRPVPSSAEFVRKALIGSVQAAIYDLADRGYLTVNTEMPDGAARIAAVLVDELTTTVLATTLAGVIRGQAGG